METVKSNEIQPSIHRKREWKVWWRLLRPHTLTASFIPVSIGTVLALENGTFNLSIFLAMLLASILIQAATNMFNEYYDYKRGLDTAESVGIGGAIVREGISPKTVMSLAISFMIIALLLGIYICITSSWWVAVIGSICMAAGYFYTGGPLPIAYTPFGELVAGLFMGPVIIGISLFIQTGEVTGKSILISIPIALLIGAILLANNIRDLEGDKVNGRQTLAILLGKRKAIALLAGMFGISYLSIIALILTGQTELWTILAFISLPKAISAIKGFRNNNTPLAMMPAMAATAQTNTIFGFWLAIGLLLTYWF